MRTWPLLLPGWFLLVLFEEFAFRTPFNWPTPINVTKTAYAFAFAFLQTTILEDVAFFLSKENI